MALSLKYKRENQIGGKMKLSLMIISLLLSGAVNAADTQNEELKDPQDLMIEMALEEMGMEGVDASQLSDADIEELEAFSKRGPGHDGRDPRNLQAAAFVFFDPESS